MTEAWTVRSVVLLFSLCCLLGCGHSSGEDQAPGVEVSVLSTPDPDGTASFDEPPVLVKYDAPEYPEQAKRAGLEGNVTVELVVGEDGRVVDASVVDSSDPAFEEAAVEAASRCEFRPAKLDGNPTRVRVRVPYQFRLGD
jgi:TonB family protein